MCVQTSTILYREGSMYRRVELCAILKGRLLCTLRTFVCLGINAKTMFNIVSEEHQSLVKSLRIVGT